MKAAAAGLSCSAFLNGATASFNVQETAPYRVDLLNTAGQLVASRGNCRGSQQIDLGHLAAQLLLYRVTTPDGRSASGRLLLQ